MDDRKYSTVLYAARSEETCSKTFHQRNFCVVEI